MKVVVSEGKESTLRLRDIDLVSSFAVRHLALTLYNALVNYIATLYDITHLAYWLRVGVAFTFGTPRKERDPVVQLPFNCTQLNSPPNIIIITFRCRGTIESPLGGVLEDKS